ncbi:MAG: hypothetical protein HY696_06105 [Deltaproteobacteria bacterium]|nr:hypothetical protein [Deltaproteobacteria bacterium]
MRRRALFCYLLAPLSAVPFCWSWDRELRFHARQAARVGCVYCVGLCGLGVSEAVAGLWSVWASRLLHDLQPLFAIALGLAWSSALWGVLHGRRVVLPLLSPRRI